MSHTGIIEKEVTLSLIIIMILTGIFGMLSTDIYAPSLPLIPKLFHTSATLAQLTISIFLGGLAITQLIAGMMSDSYGRKPVLIIGLFIFSLGTILCISASSIPILLLGRLIQGMGAGAVSVLSRIILRDTLSGLKMAQVGSYIAACIVLSPALAPVIGGFIQEHLGFTAIFIFLLLYTVLLFCLVVFYLSETNCFRHLHPLSLKNSYKNYKRVLSSSVFWANVIATGCALAVMIACAIINPFLLQNGLHMSPAHYGIYAFIAMSGLFIGMITNGYCVAKIGMKNMIFIGIVIILLGGMSFILFSLTTTLSVSVVIIPTFIITLATAFIFPNAFVGAFTPFQEMAGTVGGVYGFLQMLITVGATSLISFLGMPSQFILGMVITTLMLVSGIIYYLVGYKE